MNGRSTVGCSRREVSRGTSDFEQVDSTVLVLQLTVIVLDSILDSVGYVLVGCYRHVE
jgi:hypothetical protein